MEVVLFLVKMEQEVDRSASYMLDILQKMLFMNTRKCEIQLSYAIGVREPISIYINCFNTNKYQSG